MRGRGLRGFTLVELLIVIAIFILLMLIAVPAFSSMLYSTEQSTADNALRIGLASARDAAIRAGPGRDTGAVFVYENNRVSMLTCIRVGTLDDLVDNDPTRPVAREVFAMVPGFEPVHMPKTWTVRGYATPLTIDDEWYERTYPDTGTIRDGGNWVFPETSFYNRDAANGGPERQSFMVRFEGGTGLLKRESKAVLVFHPSESTAFRGTAPFTAPLNADDEPDGVKFVSRVLSARVTGSSAAEQTKRRQLLGDLSSDTILVKPVAQLALCNERKLGAAIGARLDRDTDTVYVKPSSYQTPTGFVPEFVPTASAVPPGLVSEHINMWLENRYPDATPANRVESDARIYTVHRYLGTLQEVTGTSGGQGVSQ